MKTIGYTFFLANATTKDLVYSLVLNILPAIVLSGIFHFLNLLTTCFGTNGCLKVISYWVFKIG